MQPIESEEAIIQGYFRKLADTPGAHGLRDDCATLKPAPGQAFVLKTDPIRSGVHFLETDTPEDIAWKALAVNVSDLAAKGARPVAYLLAMSFPEAPEHVWLQAFTDGLACAQDAMGLSLVGGDTDRAPGPISFAVTVIGELPAGRIIRRSTAQSGDLLFVSGTLGDAALGLRIHTDPGARTYLRLSEEQAELARSRYLRPQPRLGARAALRAYARASMDLSDGLLKDARRMMSASGCGCDIALDRVPLSDAFRAALLLDPDIIRDAVGHGDDYELLVAVPPEYRTEFITLASEGGVAMTEIGSCTSNAEVMIRRSDGQVFDGGTGGYDHFAH